MTAAGHEIEFTHDDGIVTARAVDVPGVAAQGRTRHEALARLMETLGKTKCR